MTRILSSPQGVQKDMSSTTALSFSLQ